MTSRRSAAASLERRGRFRRIQTEARSCSSGSRAPIPRSPSRSSRRIPRTSPCGSANGSRRSAAWTSPSRRRAGPSSSSIGTPELTHTSSRRSDRRDVVGSGESRRKRVRARLVREPRSREVLRGARAGFLGLRRVVPRTGQGGQRRGPHRAAGGRARAHPRLERLSSLTRARDVQIGETWSVQENPDGSAFVLVWFESPDPEKSFAELAQDSSDFAVWFRERVKEVSGVDLTEPPEGGPELILDWNA